MLHKHLWTFLFLNTGNLITNWLSYTHAKFEGLSIQSDKIWKWNSKISIFQLFSELGEICKYSLSQHSKILTLLHFHKLEKLRIPTTATLTNPSFQYFSELVRLKYSLRPKHKNPNFESKGKLKSYVQIWVSQLKIKEIQIKIRLVTF